MAKNANMLHNTARSYSNCIIFIVNCIIRVETSHIVRVIVLQCLGHAANVLRGYTPGSFFVRSFARRWMAPRDHTKFAGTRPAAGNQDNNKS